MKRPSTSILATTVLAAAGSFSTAQAQQVAQHNTQQEHRGTRLPNNSVIRVLPSSTTNSSQQGVRVVNGQITRVTRSSNTDPAISPAITGSDRQQRIAAARHNSNPRGAVASSQPARRIVITSATSSPVLREAARANAPQRAPQPAASLAQGAASSTSNDRAVTTPKVDRGVRIRQGGQPASTPRSVRPAANATVRPHSMQSPSPSERTVTMSSAMVQASQERKNSSMDMAARRVVTRISAAASPSHLATIRVVQAETQGE